MLGDHICHCRTTIGIIVLSKDGFDYFLVDLSSGFSVSGALFEVRYVKIFVENAGESSTATTGVIAHLNE